MYKMKWKMLNDNYIKAAKKIGEYVTCKLEVPAKVREEHDNALYELKMFLDKNGIRMTRPKWHFLIDDKTTWVYLDMIIGCRKGEKFCKQMIANPTFKYKHLMTT